MSKQRQISETTGLIKFNIGRKAQETVIEEPVGSDQVSEPPSAKKGLAISLPFSPSKAGFEDVSLSSPEKTDKHQMMMELAKKQREVSELRSRLERAEAELKELELQCRAEFVQPGEVAEIDEVIAPLMNDIKKKVNPALLKSRQSISNFIETIQQRSPQQRSPQASPQQRTSFQENGARGFLQMGSGLMNKFVKSVQETLKEEEDFDKQRDGGWFIKDTFESDFDDSDGEDIDFSPSQKPLPRGPPRGPPRLMHNSPSLRAVSQRTVSGASASDYGEEPVNL